MFFTAITRGSTIQRQMYSAGAINSADCATFMGHAAVLQHYLVRLATGSNSGMIDISKMVRESFDAEPEFGGTHFLTKKEVVLATCCVISA